MDLNVKVKNKIKRAVKLFIPDHKTYASVSVLAPNQLLAGRVALVTGGTSGIGYAIAKAFMQAGASVVITGRSEEKAGNMAARLQREAPEGCKAFGIAMDNARPSDFDAKLDACQKLFGGGVK